MLYNQILLRYILILSKKASKGSFTSEANLVTSPVTITKNADFGEFVGKEGVIFFQRKFTGTIYVFK